MAQTSRHIYPLVEWQPVPNVSYLGLPVFRHPGNGELGYDNGEYLLDLPKPVEQLIRAGAEGKLA
jgi:hypothetical protein